MISINNETSQLELNNITLKIEKENAKAMIDGFLKDGKTIRTSIYTAQAKSWSLANNFKKYPKLITLKTSPPQKIYPLSNVGINLNANDYQIENKYIAVLDTIFHINNKIELWNDLCADGTFDIWKPDAPFNSLHDKEDQMILLLRLYELNQPIASEYLDKNSVYFGSINGKHEININRPVISNDEFKLIKDNVYQKILKYNLEVKPTELINDTLLINYESLNSKTIKNVWWVNQGKTQEIEKSGGYIWAPLKRKDGQSVYYWDILSEINKDDIILNYSNGFLRYVSKVISPAISSKRPQYSYQNNWDDDGRLVRVEYFELNPPIPLEKFNFDVSNLKLNQGPLDSNSEVKQGYLFRFTNEGLKIIQNKQPETQWPNFAMANMTYEKPKEKIYPRYLIEDFEKETGFTKEKIESWKKRLLRKKHIVFQGPPGTGKTFVAQRLAKLVISSTPGIMEIVQFHPAYTYEDFIQGLRPIPTEEGLSFEIEEGRFLKFCRKAQTVNGAPCVLIIDEINRANISKVFGELMYLLEYRDQEIPLASGGKLFKIPENVFIIGTMNSADRSIALVDNAIRRRFSFIRLNPDYEVLKKYLDTFGYPSESLIHVLEEVNEAFDDPNYNIGISYFVKDGNKLKDNMPDIWTSEIEPYIEEFFFDQLKKVDAFKWESLSKNQLKEWSK